MSDWNALAAARSLPIPPDEIEKFASALSALEDEIHRLAAQLDYADEP